ncbi:glycosyltransferase 2 [Coprinopsis marcescibilis]|uniref:Glycosyltransferase 2 n=1 Tax=Coprinopsis marcescibilis TaxID=230819 RepID=A0A5C3KYJ4_COPMA|nr:glycosyltransferase 2 [Coprinopsis marcescibilis]
MHIWTPCFPATILCASLVVAGLLQEPYYRGQENLDYRALLLSNQTFDLHDSQRSHNRGDLAATLNIADRSVTGTLPVSLESIAHLHEILEPFFQHSASTLLQEIVLVVPSSLRYTATRRLQQVLALHPASTSPDFTLRTRDFDAETGPAFSLTVTDISTPWLLVMDWDGLKGLGDDTQAMLLSTGHQFLPIGPRGQRTNTTGHSAMASYLKPPFMVSRLLLPGEDGVFRTWQHVGQYFSRCNSLGAGGILLRSASNSSKAPALHALTAPVETILKTQIRFTFMLSSALDLQHLAPLACRLISDGHHLTLLVVTTDIKYNLSPVKRKARFTLGVCKLDFFTLNQFMHRREITSHLGDFDADVVVTLLETELKLNLHFMDYFATDGNVLVRLPVKDLAYCDWMASLSLEEWQSKNKVLHFSCKPTPVPHLDWYKPRLEISVITRDRPHSFKRLLDSLSHAHYFGDRVDLRMNIEQDCDLETLDLAQNYDWAQGSVFLHHRIIHAGLLPAIVESWYPFNNDSYGLLLEDDVEVSPLFYAWAKMTILKYRRAFQNPLVLSPTTDSVPTRYGALTDRSPNLFGISLYQQKHIELRQEGRIPFDAKTHFSALNFAHPSTPYLSQVPCSWGAIYFPEHWRQFHEYLSLRFSETWLTIDNTIVPNVRSNNWLRSWKKFFIELVYLKGYVMLYPNFDDFASLSTNHLELGSHVKVRSREKQEMFDLPLMPLPPLGGNTDLSRLPDGGLPRYRDLPVLNLTASITSLDEVEFIGRARASHLCHLDPPRPSIVQNLICKIVRDSS